MSKFETQTLTCPSCGEAVDFEAVASVNADRRPDLREAILDFSFQRQVCLGDDAPPAMKWLWSSTA
jgi:CpXC protein